MASEAHILTVEFSSPSPLTVYEVTIRDRHGNTHAKRGFARFVEDAVDWSRSWGVREITLDGKPYADGMKEAAKPQGPALISPDSAGIVSALSAAHEALIAARECLRINPDMQDTIALEKVKAAISALERK